jgi:hypothetical protein
MSLVQSCLYYRYLGTIHYLSLGVGWQKKGVGHEVFLTERGGAT